MCGQNFNLSTQMVSTKKFKLSALDLILMMMSIMRMTAMMTTMTIPITRRLEDPVEAVFTFLVGASVCSSACYGTKVRINLFDC